MFLPSPSQQDTKAQTRGFGNAARLAAIIQHDAVVLRWISMVTY